MVLLQIGHCFIQMVGFILIAARFKLGTDDGAADGSLYAIKLGTTADGATDD